MEVKPGYKQTEVGVIPEDWKLSPLLRVLRVASGQVDPRIEPYRSMILVAPDHIESETGRLFQKETAEDQNAISGKYVFVVGDIVYSKIRPYLRKAILANFDGLCSADMYPLKPAPNVSTGYMFAILLGHHFSKYSASVSVRSGMPKINRIELAEYNVPLPPTKAEQEAIAEALSDADALIESLEQLIAKKRLVKQGAMQELLTGKRRLPGFETKPGYKQTEVGVIPEDWEVRPLRELLDPSRSIRYGIVQPGEYDARGSLMLRSQDYSKGWANPDDMHRVSATLENQYRNAKLRHNDLIITIVGAGIGQVEVAPAWLDGAVLSRSTARIAIDDSRAARVYVGAILESPIGKRQILDCQKEGAQPVVSCRDLSAFRIPCPRKPEQEAIAAALSDMDTEIVALETKLAKARQVKQGMMQELLTGRIRLV